MAELTESSYSSIHTASFRLPAIQNSGSTALATWQMMHVAKANV